MSGCSYDACCASRPSGGGGGGTTVKTDEPLAALAAYASDHPMAAAPSVSANMDPRSTPKAFELRDVSCQADGRRSVDGEMVRFMMGSLSGSPASRSPMAED